MAVHVVVGAAANAIRFQAEALRAWRQCASRLGRPLSFDVASLRAEQFFENCAGQAVAKIHLQSTLGPDLVEIMLSEQFFANTPELRFSTLLHEIVHVALLTGPFRERYAATDALDRREENRAVDRCTTQRYRMAFGFWNMPNEVAAEWFLLREYPEHADLRLQHYLEMRRANLIQPQQARVERPLKAHAHFYELLRAELGLRLSAERPICAGMLGVRNEVHQGFTSAEYDQALVDRLLAMQDDCLAIPTGSEDVSRTIGAVFEDILQLPC